MKKHCFPPFEGVCENCHVNRSRADLPCEGDYWSEDTKGYTPQVEESWETVKSEDHWLEVKDRDGWYEAVVKWDGCVHYTRYYNEPLSKEEGNSEYSHICSIQGEIDRLYSLLQVARKHYKSHHYYGTAFEKEPKCIEQALRTDLTK